MRNSLKLLFCVTGGTVFQVLLPHSVNLGRLISKCFKYLASLLQRRKCCRLHVLRHSFWWSEISPRPLPDQNPLKLNFSAIIWIAAVFQMKKLTQVQLSFVTASPLTLLCVQQGFSSLLQAFWFLIFEDPCFPSCHIQPSSSARPSSRCQYLLLKGDVHAWLGSGQQRAEGTQCLGAARIQLGIGCILRLFQGHFVPSQYQQQTAEEDISVLWEQAEEGKSQYPHSLKENGQLTLGLLSLY